jgi:hypothetical protein
MPRGNTELASGDDGKDRTGGTIITTFITMSGKQLSVSPSRFSIKIKIQKGV